MGADTTACELTVILSHTKMPIKINHRLSKESFTLACKICEQDNPSITYNAARHFSYEMNRLILLDAFKVGSLKYVLTDEGNYEELKYHDDKPGYLDMNKKFVEISYNDIKNYNLDLTWIVKTIGNNINISNIDLIEEIIPNTLWQIGIINLEIDTPIFFARRIRTDDVFVRINKALSDRNSDIKGIILTSCDDIPNYFNSKIAGHKIIVLDKCLTYNQRNFHIDKNILKAAVVVAKKEGFSSGYRSAYFNGEYFRFTKQEADVLELLDKAKKPIHKDEIMAEVSENNTELKLLFRNDTSKNIRHSILQYDNKGYYWLNNQVT